MVAPNSEPGSTKSGGGGWPLIEAGGAGRDSARATRPNTRSGPSRAVAAITVDTVVIGAPALSGAPPGSGIASAAPTLERLTSTPRAGPAANARELSTH